MNVSLFDSEMHLCFQTTALMVRPISVATLQVGTVGVKRTKTVLVPSLTQTWPASTTLRTLTVIVFQLHHDIVYHVKLPAFLYNILYWCFYAEI